MLNKESSKQRRTCRCKLGFILLVVVLVSTIFLAVPKTTLAEVTRYTPHYKRHPEAERQWQEIERMVLYDSYTFDATYDPEFLDMGTHGTKNTYHHMVAGDYNGDGYLDYMVFVHSDMDTLPQHDLRVRVFTTNEQGLSYLGTYVLGDRSCLIWGENELLYYQDLFLMDRSRLTLETIPYSQSGYGYLNQADVESLGNFQLSLNSISDDYLSGYVVFQDAYNQVQITTKEMLDELISQLDSEESKGAYLVFDYNRVAQVPLDFTALEYLFDCFEYKSYTANDLRNYLTIADLQAAGINLVSDYDAVQDIEARIKALLN